MTSLATRKLQSEARYGKQMHGPETRAKIAAAVRQAWAEGRHRVKFRHLLTEDERRKYRNLRAYGCSRVEALRAIGRGDVADGIGGAK